MVMMILVTLTMVFGNSVGLVLIMVLEGLLGDCLGLLIWSCILFVTSILRRLA